MTSIPSRSKPIPIPVPISIPPNDSSPNDEDGADFVGTPYRFDRSNPYEYPFPPSKSTIPKSTTPTSARVRSSSHAPPLSNVTPTHSFLSHNKSSSTHSSRSSRSAPPTAPSKPPSARAPPPPPARLHSRLPSTITITLKLDMPTPVPPKLIGRNLGSLSPALGLEPGELLTLEKANTLGRRERLDGPAPARPTQPGR